MVPPNVTCPWSPYWGGVPTRASPLRAALLKLHTAAHRQVPARKGRGLWRPPGCVGLKLWEKRCESSNHPIPSAINPMHGINSALAHLFSTSNLNCSRSAIATANHQRLSGCGSMPRAFGEHPRTEKTMATMPFQRPMDTNGPCYTRQWQRKRIAYNLRRYGYILRCQWEIINVLTNPPIFDGKS